ncbi:MAG: hypothetical protein ACRDRH_01320 [Pseudonocardia sp.]
MLIAEQVSKAFDVGAGPDHFAAVVEVAVEELVQWHGGGQLVRVLEKVGNIGHGSAFRAGRRFRPGRASGFGTFCG